MRTSAMMGSVALAWLATGAAYASSDQAWAEFDARVTHACIAASGISKPMPSAIIGFDDRVGMVAMLVKDRTRGSSEAKLCLYDKRAQKAYVDEAQRWSAPLRSR
jgi:hypothetical protein